MTDVEEDQRADRPDVRLRDAMPAPLLAFFAVLALGTFALIAFLMLKPPDRETVPLGERHSPPKGNYTHDVGRVAPVRLPALPTSSSATGGCSPLETLRIEAGPAGQARLGEAVRELCRLATGAGAELSKAVGGLSRMTLRFAAFERSGEEATTDTADRVVYINLRFARSATPIVHIVPVLVHEGWHLGNGAVLPTAQDEYRARVAELEACKHAVDKDEWIRNCHDAQAFVRLGEERAVALLREAGYR